MLSLRELQLHFSAALGAGLGAGETPGARDRRLLDAVSDGSELGAAARLEIYADMYRARLVDVLREDFPRVLLILGEDEFRAVAYRYLARHPSTHPSVRYVGRCFAGFLTGEELNPPFLGDLASLEWARVEVFDAPDAEPLRRDAIESLAPAEWPALRLRPIPACRVMSCAWPVHRHWEAAGTGDAEAVIVGSPAVTTIRVWREGFSVSHAAMGALERRLFTLLERGEPFARLCAAAEAGLDPDAAAHAVGGLLMRWVEDGLLLGIPS